MNQLIGHRKAGAVLFAMMASGLAASNSDAVPYNAWLQPYAGSDVGNSMVLMHFDETSGTTATNSGNTTTFGTSDGAYFSDASGNTASGAGIPASGFEQALTTSSAFPTPVTIPSAASLEGPFVDGYVIEMWFNASSLPSTGEAVLVDKWDPGSGGRHYFLSIAASGKLFFASQRSDGVFAFMDGATTLQADTWYHVAAQYDSGDDQWELWLNDNLEDTSAAGAWGFTTTLNAITLGASPGNVSPFDGQIDEFRISSGQYDFSLIPEPGALALSLFGLSLIAMRRNRHLTA